MTNVLAAVDGTDGSARAASFARELARRFEARLETLDRGEEEPVWARGEVLERGRRVRALGEALLGEPRDGIGAGRGERAAVGALGGSRCAAAGDGHRRTVHVNRVEPHGQPPGWIRERLPHRHESGVGQIRPRFGLATSATYGTPARTPLVPTT